MLSIAEFTLPADEFPLGRVFDGFPEATLELDRVVPSGDTVWPYFWVHVPGGDLEAVRAVFEDCPELRAAVLMEDLGDRGLFRAEWRPEHMGIMGAIAASEVTVVSASGTREGWTFELRATDPDQLSAFQSHCAEHHIPVTLTRLDSLSERDADGGSLTPAQREALVAAYEAGYYEDPRAASLEDIAADLDISRQALAARLRRAYRALVESAVLAGAGDRPGSDRT